MCSFLVFVGLLNLVYINCQEPTIYGRSTGLDSRNGIINLSNSYPPGFNMTYIDKPDNILLIPSINQNDENKHRKHYKKNPKRTIQKIIKKNRVKKKYSMHRASTSTVPSMKDDIYAQEDNTRSEVTGQPSLKKKSRKYSLKVARYPTYKYQGKKDYRRTKRDANRDDLYILKDFDEMEFVKADGDYDVVKSNVQKYW